MPSKFSVYKIASILATISWVSFKVYPHSLSLSLHTVLVIKIVYILYHIGFLDMYIHWEYGCKKSNVSWGQHFWNSLFLSFSLLIPTNFPKCLEFPTLLLRAHQYLPYSVATTARVPIIGTCHTSWSFLMIRYHFFGVSLETSLMLLWLFVY